MWMPWRKLVTQARHYNLVIVGPGPPKPSGNRLIEDVRCEREGQACIDPSERPHYLNVAWPTVLFMKGRMRVLVGDSSYGNWSTECYEYFASFGKKVKERRFKSVVGYSHRAHISETIRYSWDVTGEQ